MRPIQREIWKYSSSVVGLAIIIGLLLSSAAMAEIKTGVLLPDGTEFVSWEVPSEFTKTYYVDNNNPSASDNNPGTKKAPFLTINKAAQVLEAGERVVIMEGVYREKVMPLRGGTGPDKIISYEAAPGAKVIVKGSRLAKSGWESSTGFSIGKPDSNSQQMKIYQLNLEQFEFKGYNPFGMANGMMERFYLKPKGEELKPHAMRRGMIFVDGKKLEQVECYRDMTQKDGTFWPEHNGMTVHVRLAEDANPSEHEVELVIQEHVFSPQKRYLGYIRIKGITFEHAASGFPVPQRGLVSTNCGHHWIIEDCVIRHANSVGMDIGNQNWTYDKPLQIGYMIVRRNQIIDAGICGLAGVSAIHTLVEYNLIENIGWQNAELAWESGGLKFHETEGTVIRNNVIRHTIYAPGIWLDYANKNTRVTGNVIGDLIGTVRGGIYLEASQYQNMLDNNIIWKTTRGKGGSGWNIADEGGWGIIIDGSDETIIAHNLLGECEDAGVKTRTVEGRIVESRGGTSFWNQVLNNIFYQCGKSIDFSHKENTAEGNIYEKNRRNRDLGLNWLHTHEGLRVDLPAWQKYFGFDKQGAVADMNISVDLDALTMSWSAKDKLPQIETGKHFQHDLLGQTVGKRRCAGPINQLPEEARTIRIDPRQ
jgi:hypothetical protein